MKFGLQAVKRLMICMPERFHTLEALGPLKGQPLGVPTPPLGHKIHIFRENQLKLEIRAVETLRNCIRERYHTLGALGARKGSP